MECSGILYDETGSAENIHIVVPLDNDDGIFSSKDMLKSLPTLQKRINAVLTAKIGDDCVVEPTDEQNEDQE
ncbi:hypothetical protein ECG_09263 [Echinococcus granulosus]|uniref:Expressed conserved protein n=1 Tax=Echinococcus granulosus TaxID=6210 RepID=U6JJ96_ECHGR|nr:hypothetical protein EGR_06886 [Echinococcus granulosus]EUB58251.1 hypothetical protein EGR_06886 [Echinococcus granulosus]KAH9278560.1 hypothetical protein ECG_09263 [Echinococcus granulosus]CDS23399.1 expressed conserved protein [Echinococcus granulosus]